MLGLKHDADNPPLVVGVPGKRRYPVSRDSNGGTRWFRDNSLLRRSGVSRFEVTSHQQRSACDASLHLLVGVCSSRCIRSRGRRITCPRFRCLAKRNETHSSDSRWPIKSSHVNSIANSRLMAIPCAIDRKISVASPASKARAGPFPPRPGRSRTDRSIIAMRDVAGCRRRSGWTQPPITSVAWPGPPGSRQGRSYNAGMLPTPRFDIRSIPDARRDPPSARDSMPASQGDDEGWSLGVCAAASERTAVSFCRITRERVSRNLVRRRARVPTRSRWTLGEVRATADRPRIQKFAVGADRRQRKTPQLW